LTIYLVYNWGTSHRFNQCGFTCSTSWYEVQLAKIWSDHVFSTDLPDWFVDDLYNWISNRRGLIDSGIGKFLGSAITLMLFLWRGTHQEIQTITGLKADAYFRYLLELRKQHRKRFIEQVDNINDEFALRTYPKNR